MIKSQPYQHPSLTFRSPTSPPPSSFPISSVVSPTQSLSSSFGPFQQQSSRPFPQSLTSTTSPPPLSDSIQLNSSTNSTLQSISSSPPGSSSLSSSPPSLSSSVSQHHQLQPSSINSIINSTSNIIPLQSASSSIMSHNLQSSNFFQPFPSAATPNNSQYSQSHSFASNPSSMSLTTNNPSMSFPIIISSNRNHNLRFLFLLSTRLLLPLLLKTLLVSIPTQSLLLLVKILPRLLIILIFVS